MVVPAVPQLASVTSQMVSCYYNNSLLLLVLTLLFRTSVLFVTCNDQYNNTLFMTLIIGVERRERNLRKLLLF